MRVRLEKSFQNSLIYKLKGKKTWAELSRKFDTTPYALRKCAISGNTLPKVIYNKMRTKETDRFIIEILADNWGQVKGGKNSTGSTKSIKKPNPTKELAEAIGIILGDGSNYLNRQRGVYQVRIAGNIHNEQKYFINFLKPLFEKLFSIRGRIVKNPKSGSINLCFDSRELVYFLDRVGIPFDTRKKQIGIPKWVMRKDKFLKSCIRGLIDTDGSIHRLSNKDPQLIRISFKNTNEHLLSDVRTSLLRLGFHPSKFIKNQIFLTRKDDIKMFVNDIGFSNPKNIERFIEFSPVV